MIVTTISRAAEPLAPVDAVYGLAAVSSLAPRPVNVAVAALAATSDSLRELASVAFRGKSSAAVTSYDDAV